LFAAFLQGRRLDREAGLIQGGAKMIQRIYKVRRQKYLLDDSTRLQRSTKFATYDEVLIVGHVYIMHVDGKRAYYYVESLVREIYLD
jgi:hypothetical protein